MLLRNYIIINETTIVFLFQSNRSHSALTVCKAPIASNSPLHMLDPTLLSSFEHPTTVWNASTARFPTAQTSTSPVWLSWKTRSQWDTLLTCTAAVVGEHAASSQSMRNHFDRSSACWTMFGHWISLWKSSFGGLCITCGKYGYTKEGYVIECTLTSSALRIQMTMSKISDSESGWWQMPLGLRYTTAMCPSLECDITRESVLGTCFSRKSL